MFSNDFECYIKHRQKLSARLVRKVNVINKLPSKFRDQN